jgi:hypothetical protein
MRTLSIRTTLGLLFGLAACGATAAQAQETSLVDAAQRLQPGQRIDVTTTDGSVVAGTLTRLTDTGVTLEVEGKAVDRPAAAITEIGRRGDSLVNGLLYGAIGGGVPAILLVGNQNTDLAAPGAWAALFFGGGVGLGVAIDALIEGRTVVYRAPARRTAVAPILTRGRAGVALHLRF